MHDLDFDLSTLRPEPGDLVVFHVKQQLTKQQRQAVLDSMEPWFEQLGCKFIVLEGGMSLQLVKAG